MGADATRKPRSLLADIVREQRRQAHKACAEIREAADSAGCPLPSLAVESTSAITGSVLVQLGGAPPDVITKLAKVIRAGTIALAAEVRPGEHADLISEPTAVNGTGVS
ncbi:hypothetical protein [Kitasatospora sp. NPDC088346]|uniref:hypothetical protein n=1 Tax=Kitasatospora sp. NPDC088346 TaxID=3364073 RepID=UPI00380D57FF